MESILEFLHKLTDDYLYYTLFGIIILVILIFLGIVLHLKSKRNKEEKTIKQFKNSSFKSLTTEEINNISNNSANPQEVKEYLTGEVTAARSETESVKKSKPSNSKKTSPKASEKTQTKKVQKDKKEDTATKPIKKSETKDTKAKTTAKKVEPKKVDEVSDIENAKTADQKRQYTGKWKIIQEGEGFVAILTASNGGLLLKTEKYKSLSGVKNGIETIKKNVAEGNFAISVDKYGHYRFKLFNLNNRLICVSEDYSSKAKCENGIDSVKRFAQTSTLIIEEK